METRKNLLVYSSGLRRIGSQQSRGLVQLCVTGKLKKDDYCRAVQKIVRHEPEILLTDYVDESSKLDPYRNALSLVSSSLAEGFGIPVLDAACLGMPTIASDFESHLRTQA